MAPTELQYTPVGEIEKIHATLKAEFGKGKTKDIAFRKRQLSGLAYLVKDNLKRFEDALAEDLGRPLLESHLLELSGSVHDAVEAYNSVDKWAKTESAPWSINFALVGPKIRKEPKGTVLIISPFNYPVWLCLGPLSGAIAAGNACVIKPSESTRATSALLAELFPKYLDPTLYAVVNGAVPETTKLLELQWDHILYTGNGRVARIVAAAAAKHLTPLTLELGGKNPVFIDPKTDLVLAARRISWGKFMNSGQTCTAPDYILVPAEAQDKLIEAFAEVNKTFYPDGAIKSDSYSRIVSDMHFRRLKGLLDATKGKIAVGGELDESQRFIAPTIVRDVTFEDSLMREEIFGPILPIIPVKDIDQAIELINTHDHPLAVYIFSNDSKMKQKVFDNTQSGAAVANDVAFHPGVEGLPFGGVGESGYGQHTGKFGFDTFTHLRSTVDSPKIFDLFMGGRFPPYTNKKLNTFKKLLYPPMPPRGGGSSGWKISSWFSALLCVAVALGVAGRLTGSPFNLFVYVQNLIYRGK